MKAEPGILYVVATPIGNLEDLSRRAEKILAETDWIAAEDTRRTRKLLSRLGLTKRFLSYYEPKEERVLPMILERLQRGENVALVADAGTPGISDPGYRLVRAALAAGIRVVPIPGPSALTAVLCASGLPTDRVTFAGFLPNKSPARHRALAELKERRDTLVFFEAPSRLLSFLEDALAILGERQAAVWREISKVYEEQVRGTLSELVARFSGKEVKGEITVVIEGNREEARWSEEELEARLAEEVRVNPRPVALLAAELARLSGWPRQEVYRRALVRVQKKP